MDLVRFAGSSPSPRSATSRVPPPELRISQPGLSRAIARLERELRAPLFDREGRTLRLNRYGEIFREHAERLVATEDAARRALAQAADPDHGEVGLAFLHTQGTVLVPELLRSYRSEHPRVTFRLTQGSSERIEEAVSGGHADMAITCPAPGGPGLASAQHRTAAPGRSRRPPHRRARRGGPRGGRGRALHRDAARLRPALDHRGAVPRRRHPAGDRLRGRGGHDAARPGRRGAGRRGRAPGRRGRGGRRGVSRARGARSASPGWPIAPARPRWRTSAASSSPAPRNTRSRNNGTAGRSREQGYAMGEPAPATRLGRTEPRRTGWITRSPSDERSQPATPSHGPFLPYPGGTRGATCVD